MSEIVTLLSVFLISTLASIFGTIIGGGTIFSIPFLIMIGIPPQIAIATERFGGLGQSIASFLKFLKSEKIIWKYIIFFIFISLISSLIGSTILINTDSEAMNKIIGLTVLIILPLLFFKKDLGTKHIIVSKNKIIIGSILYFFIQILAAFYGGGTGILTSYTLMFCFGLTVIESKATKTIPWLFLSISSVIIFAIKGIINYKLGFIMLIGMAIGGYLGTYIMLKKGETWVKRLFLLFAIISIIQLFLK